MKTNRNAENGVDPLEGILRDLVPEAVDRETAERIAGELAKAPRLGVIEGGAFEKGERSGRRGMERLKAAAIVAAVAVLAAVAWSRVGDGMLFPNGEQATVVAPAGDDASETGLDALRESFESGGRAASDAGGSLQTVRFAPALDGVRDGGMVWRENGRPYRIINFDFADQYIIEPETSGGEVRVTIPRREQLMVPVRSF